MKNIYRTLLVAAAGLMVLAGCQKEDHRLAKAILTSANLLEFEAEKPIEQMITVYADADWTVEKPEWVIVEPAQGTGMMDVIISVTPNMEGNVMNNPRKCELIFKGANLASQAVVEVNQKGDKFKGVQEMTVSEVVAAAEETMVIIPESQVMAVAGDGFIVSDGTANLFIGAETEVQAGDKVRVMGMKVNVAGLPAIQTPDEVSVSGNAAVTYPAAKDISAEIDQFNADSRVYISVEGEYNGSVIKVEGQQFGVHPLNPDPAFNLAALKGGILKLSGYFAGRAEPVINMTVAKVEKKGQSKVVWFQEDFSWLKPFIETWNAGNSTKISDSVKEQTSSADGAPNLFTKFEGFAAACRERGYDDYTGLTNGIYLQDAYLKFSKGELPNGLKINAPFKASENYKGEPVTIEFDWCAHGGGTGKIDGTQIVVEIVGNGQFVDNGAKISTPVASKQAEAQYFWQHVAFKAEELDIDSKIYIRPLNVDKNEGEFRFQRWHLDNIMIYTEP